MQPDLFDDQANDPVPQASPSGLEPPARHPAGFWIGTCAWQYPEWDRHFYPASLPKKRQLAYYVRFHNAVEVDSSFYRVPSAASVEQWRDETPGGFMFAMKAPRSLTHDAGLSLEAETARRDWESFLAVSARLGRRLGPILLQLGPRTTIRDFARLRAVGDTIPSGMRVAVEFRHPSMHTAEVNAWLRERGFVRAWTDQYLNPETHVKEDDPEANAATGDFTFVRLMGNLSEKYDRATGGRLFQYGKILFDRRADMAKWIGKLRALPPGRPVFVFASNHYEGFAVLTAASLRGGIESAR